MKTQIQEYKKFSKQESKVFELLISEHKNYEIAKILKIDEKTVGTYKLRILTKAKAKTIIGLYLFNEKYKIVKLSFGLIRNFKVQNKV